MNDTLEITGDAAIVRIRGTNKALALTSDCTPRYVEADPFLGAMQAVVETYRNISAVGATSRCGPCWIGTPSTGRIGTAWDECWIHPWRVIWRARAWRSCSTWDCWNATPKEFAAAHAAIIAGMERCGYKPEVGKEMPLGDAPRAHEEVMKPGAYGKIVLIP